MRKIERDTRGSIAAIGAVIGILILCVAGILIYNKFSGQLHGLGTEANTTAVSMNSTANLVFTLAPYAALILVAGVIIAVVMTFGKRE